MKQKGKGDIFLSFFFLILYLYTSRPTGSMTVGAKAPLFLLALPYALSMIAIFRYRIDFRNKYLGYLMLALLCWAFLQYRLNPGFSFSPFILGEVFVAYVAYSLYKRDVLERFERTTVLLAKIALVGWVLCVVANPAMQALARAIGGESDNGISYTMYFFSVSTDTGNYLGLLPRNSGFAWEPGRCSCMLVVALMINMLRTRMKYDKNFFILLACLLTTQSTTGFVSFMALFAIMYLRTKKFNPLFYAGIAAVMLSAMSLPFMRSKIVNVIQSATSESMAAEMENLNYLADGGGADSYYVPQRFQGLVYSAMNLINSNPLIGEGRDLNLFYVNRTMGWQIKTSEGLIEHAVRYGLLLALLSFFLLLKASEMISTHYRSEIKYLYFILFLIISIGYNFWEEPLFMTIWMTPLFEGRLKRKKNIKMKQKAKRLPAVQRYA